MASPEDKRLEVLELAKKARHVLQGNLPEMIEEVDLIVAEAVSRLEAGMLDPLGAFRYLSEVAGLIRFSKRMQARVSRAERIDKKSLHR